MSLRKNTLSVTFSLLSLSYAWMLVSAYAPNVLNSEKQIPLQALILSQQLNLESIPWKTFDPEELDEGVSAPPGTNVILTIPPDAPAIRRETLFGNRGKDTRYWGYCFDNDYAYQRNITVAESGFPGKMFLSEAEREWRAERVRLKKPLFTIYNVPTKRDLESEVNGPIRHQIELFQPGTTCYLMTSKLLPTGTDRDDDGLNARRERDGGTEPLSPDSDGDGIFDGVEKDLLKTDPLRRDTDGDGLIDGLEDKNHNGLPETGETNALRKDTDNDGLCDGYCRQFTENSICPDNTGNNCKALLYGRWMGEDKNLNGKVDTGETDPRLWSTTADGISDMQTYYKCILAGGKSC